MEKSKLIEFKLQNLFLLRNLLVQIIIVLTGGVVGLCFAETSTVRNIFISLGTLIDIAMLHSFVQNGLAIKNSLYRKEIK